MEESPQKLSIDSVITGKVLEGKLKVYELEIVDNTKMLVISAEPADEESDPDIYVGVNDPLVDQDNYVWKSTNIGADKLEIHPEDESFIPGLYHIAILGYKPDINTFVLSVKAQEIQEIIDLPMKSIHVISDQKFFKFPVKWPGESRIEVEVDPGKHKLALFSSSTMYYPTQDEHQWSSGLFVWDKIIYEYDNYAFDLDPYDHIMKRQFTRIPTEHELTRIKTFEDDEEYVQKTLKDLDLGDDDKLRFCIDTDDWRYTAQICFFSLKNLTNQDIEVEITRREVFEEELLTEEQISKYRWFKQVFDQVEGGSVSQKERKRLQISEQSEFTYGEIEFIHIQELFSLCEPANGEVFWDLGCGAGKCLLAMGLLYPNLSYLKGVEYLPALKLLCENTLRNVPSTIQIPEIDIVCGDMLEVDWSDADIIFTSSICFPDEFMEQLQPKFDQLKVGTRIMTLKGLADDTNFSLKFNLRVKMTWGKTGVYVYEKLY